VSIKRDIRSFGSFDCFEDAARVRDIASSIILGNQGKKEDVFKATMDEVCQSLESDEKLKHLQSGVPRMKKGKWVR
jgi:hypothetical protein